MATSIKVFYSRPNLPDDVRRFKLDAPLEFEVFARKIYGLFGVNGGSITWKDEDGDAITIGNTDDLVEATRTSASTLKVYFVSRQPVNEEVFVAEQSDEASTDSSDGWEQVAAEVELDTENSADLGGEPETERTQAEEASVQVEEEASEEASDEAVQVEEEAVVVHERVQCDATGEFPIKGNRWHKIGEDFDLCEVAFQALPESEKKLFELIATPGATPVKYESSAESVDTDAAVHVGVKCDLSNMLPIIGNRWHLIGHNYDVCQAEFDKLPKEQKQRFELIAQPGQRGVPFGYPMRFTRDGDAAEQAAALLRTVLTALQDNYSVEIDLVPRGQEDAHGRGPIQAEVPISVDATHGELKVEVEVPKEASVSDNSTHASGAAVPEDDKSIDNSKDRCSRGWRQKSRRGRGRGRQTVPAGHILPAAPISTGMCGDGVKQLQDVLVRHGYLNLDAISLRQGFFGPRTTAAIRSFQAERRIGNRSAWGVFDEETREALLKVDEEFDAALRSTVSDASSASQIAHADESSISLNDVNTDDSVQVQPAETTQVPVKWADELEVLRSMGFENSELLVPILDRTNGHVDAVIAALLD
mmetsp:Transcript_69564/g.96726  ORF Transcript_69564/g.96726 Transcript_69564/m.96726 type:complete len:589 (+) Transcript_69564:109-1875(+)